MHRSRLNSDSNGKPTIGKDFLRRTTQLEEKQGLSTRRPLSKNTSLHIRRTGLRDGAGEAGSTVAACSTTKPAMKRSSTTPQLSIETSAAHESIDADQARDRRTSKNLSSTPICLSPTWSRGNAHNQASHKNCPDRLKGEGNRDETGNNGSEQRRGRARKRLSKKPPAAMETQGYAIAMSSPTRSDASGKNSRRGSFSGSSQTRRFSISSFSSTLRFPDLLFGRSSSQPPTPLNGSSNSGLQEIQSSKHKSQQPSKSSTFTKFSSEDEAYVTDLVDFACEMGISSQKALEADVTKAKNTQHRHQAVSRSAQGLSNTSPSTGNSTHAPPNQAMLAKQNDKRQSKGLKKRQLPHLGKQDNATGGYEYPNFKKLLRKQKAKTVDAISTLPPYQSSTSLQSFRSQSVSDVGICQSSELGKLTSYVQKHRVSHEERSIAKFREELAIKKATEAIYASPTDFSRPLNESHHLPKQIKRTESEPVHDIAKINPVGRRSQESLPSQLKIRPGRKREVQIPRTASATTEKKQISSHVLSEPAFGTVKRRESKQPITEAQDGGAANPEPSKSDPNGDIPTRKKIGPGAPTVFKDELSSSPVQEAFAPKDAPTVDVNNSIGMEVLSAHNGGPNLGSTSQEATTVSPGLGKATIRRSSVKRSRSDTDLTLRVHELESISPSFLSQLKHQSQDIKSSRNARVSFALPDKPIQKTSRFQAPKPAPYSSLSDLVDVERRKERSRRPGTSPGFSEPFAGGPLSILTLNPGPNLLGSQRSGIPSSLSQKPTAKLFVICCECQKWHDLPSKIYEAMALPRSFFKGDTPANGIVGGQDSSKQVPSTRLDGLEGKVFTAVKCPWCGHGMSTSCCAGWTAIVYRHEKHH